VLVTSTMDSVALRSTAWQIGLTVAIASLGVFVFKLITMRMIFFKLKKQGLVRSVPITLMAKTC
jgi:hypothetical protein